MVHPRHATCIAICQLCADSCGLFIHACQPERTGDELLWRRLVRDCATLCRLTAVVLARHSSYWVQACRLCAEVCEDCAVACALLTNPHSETCEQVCRRCAEECRALLSRVVG